MLDKLLASNERIQYILSIIKNEGVCAQADVAAELNVSSQTIRRDFAALQQTDLICVRNGLAYFNKHYQGDDSETVAGLDNPGPEECSAHEDEEGLTNLDYTTRQTTCLAEKRAIAEAIAEDIPDGSVVLLTAGTTNEQVAAALGAKKHHLAIITNSIRVADILCYQGGDNLVCTPGGTVRHANGAIDQNDIFTKEMISEYYDYSKIDYMITSIGGISQRGHTQEYESKDVILFKNLRRYSKKLILALDHTKLRSVPLNDVFSPDEIDDIYCDQYVNPSLAKIFADHHVIFHKVDVTK